MISDRWRHVPAILWWAAVLVSSSYTRAPIALSPATIGDIVARHNRVRWTLFAPDAGAPEFARARALNAQLRAKAKLADDANFAHGAEYMHRLDYHLRLSDVCYSILKEIDPIHPERGYAHLSDIGINYTVFNAQPNTSLIRSAVDEWLSTSWPGDTSQNLSGKATHVKRLAQAILPSAVYIGCGVMHFQRHDGAHFTGFMCKYDQLLKMKGFLSPLPPSIFDGRPAGGASETSCDHYAGATWDFASGLCVIPPGRRGRPLASPMNAVGLQMELLLNCLRSTVAGGLFADASHRLLPSTSEMFKLIHDEELSGLAAVTAAWCMTTPYLEHRFRYQKHYRIDLSDVKFAEIVSKSPIVGDGLSQAISDHIVQSAFDRWHVDLWKSEEIKFFETRNGHVHEIPDHQQIIFGGYTRLGCAIADCSNAKTPVFDLVCIFKTDHDRMPLGATPDVYPPLRVPYAVDRPCVDAIGVKTVCASYSNSAANPKTNLCMTEQQARQSGGNPLELGLFEPERKLGMNSGLFTHVKSRNAALYASYDSSYSLPETTVQLALAEHNRRRAELMLMGASYDTARVGEALAPLTYSPDLAWQLSKVANACHLGKSGLAESEHRYNTYYEQLAPHGVEGAALAAAMVGRTTTPNHLYDVDLDQIVKRATELWWHEGRNKFYEHVCSSYGNVNRRGFLNMSSDLIDSMGCAVTRCKHRDGPKHIFLVCGYSKRSVSYGGAVWPGTSDEMAAQWRNANLIYPPPGQLSAIDGNFSTDETAHIRDEMNQLRREFYTNIRHQTFNELAWSGVLVEAAQRLSDRCYNPLRWRNAPYSIVVHLKDASGDLHQLGSRRGLIDEALEQWKKERLHPNFIRYQNELGRNRFSVGGVETIAKIINADHRYLGCAQRFCDFSFVFICVIHASENIVADAGVATMATTPSH